MITEEDALMDKLELVLKALERQAELIEFIPYHQGRLKGDVVKIEERLDTLEKVGHLGGELFEATGKRFDKLEAAIKRIDELQSRLTILEAKATLRQANEVLEGDNKYGT